MAGSEGAFGPPESFAFDEARVAPEYLRNRRYAERFVAVARCFHRLNRGEIGVGELLEALDALGAHIAEVRRVLAAEQGDRGASGPS